MPDIYRMHVFADLKAYTCTFEECRGTQGPYPQRSTWADHEFREHFTKIAWTCRFCDRSEESADTYSTHLQNNHDVTFTDTRLEKFLKDDRMMTLKPVSLKSCPLCLKDGWSSHRSYFVHVGRHLEEVALAVLPLEVDEEESGSEPSISEAISNTGSLETTIHSPLSPPVKDPASFQATETGHGSLSAPLANDVAHNTAPKNSVPEGPAIVNDTGNVSHLLDHLLPHGYINETSAATIQQAQWRPEEVQIQARLAKDQVETQHIETYFPGHLHGDFEEFGHLESMLDEYKDGWEPPTRPLLTRDQVDMLESQFQIQPKPNTNIKRQLAVQTKLTLPRVAVSLNVSSLNLKLTSIELVSESSSKG